jgi:hypothetical protein
MCVCTYISYSTALYVVGDRACDAGGLAVGGARGDT